MASKNQLAVSQKKEIELADIAGRHNMAAANAADTGKRAVAGREYHKQNHAILTDALKSWAEYVDPLETKPSQRPETYYMTVNNMIYSRLGLGHIVRHANATETSIRDWMTPTEALAIASAETAMADAIRDGMAAGASRKDIKEEYTKAADRTRDHFLPLIQAERVRGGAV